MQNIIINNQFEAIYKPQINSTKIALLCHPHPLHNGNMHSKVLVYIEKGLIQNNFTTLRFNFGSANQKRPFRYGLEEIIDAKKALDWLILKHPNFKVLTLAGFSFGSYITIELLKNIPTLNNYFICVGTPTELYDCSYLAKCQHQGLIIHSDQDEICSIHHLEELLKNDQYPANKSYQVISGDNHFFTKHLNTLQDKVYDYLANNIQINP